MSTLNMHYDDVLRDQAAKLEKKEEAARDDQMLRQLNKQVDDLSEQVAKLRDENDDLRRQLQEYEAGYDKVDD